MPTFTSHAPGTFSWLELATKDSAAAKRFYGGLFGWTFEDTPAGPDMVYTFCKLGEQTAAALFQMGSEMAAQVPVHWGSYVTVTDVDAATAKAKANGAQVLKEPFDVMDVGRMSVIADPSGAALNLWQAKKHIGTTVKGETGALCWNELMTSNVDAAGKFYVNTFGWNATAIDMGPMGTYTLFKLNPNDDKSSVGGMMGLSPDMKGVPSHWLAYIQVNDCDASAKKVTELGGKIIVPPTDIPNIGRFAIFQDPTGGTLALYKHMH